jgi:hypothetical protein
MDGLRRFTLVAGLVMLAGIAEAEERFVAGVEDVPLMPGLSEVPELTLVFDAPSGRVVEAYAQGRTESGAVLGFYARTLPELGWVSTGPNRFRRERESLVIEFPGDRIGARLVVRFFISPG